MSITVRPASLTDVPAICRLQSQELGYHCTLEMTRRRLEDILQKPENRVWIAETDGRLSGFVHAADYDCIYCESLKNILAIAVDHTVQRQGVGRALVCAVEDWARECGSAGVRLVSGMDRQGAHRFYEACGYFLRKEQKNFMRLFDAPASDAAKGEGHG